MIYNFENKTPKNKQRILVWHNDTWIGAYFKLEGNELYLDNQYSAVPILEYWRDMPDPPDTQ